MNKILLTIVFSCYLLVDAEHPQDGGGGIEIISHRNGKIFSKTFWDGFEKGIDDTFEVLHRVRNNLEVAMDQVSDNLETSFSSFADRIDDRVEEALPHFLRRETHHYKVGEPIQVFSNSVPVGGGANSYVDDGLEVYYGNSDENQDREDYEEIAIARLPEKGKVPQRPVGVQKPSRVRNPFDNIFNGPIFRPFNFGNNNGNNFFNIFRRTQWWQGENVCIDREETDEAEKNTNEQLEAEAEKNTNEQLEAEAEISTDQVTEEESTSTTDVPASARQAPEEEEKPVESSPNPSMINFNFGVEMSTCSDLNDKYTCVTKTGNRGIYKTVKVSYRCCHGFVRDGQGCMKVHLDSMSDTLQKLESSTDFLSLVKAANLLETIDNGNLTIFVPSNEAIEEYTMELEMQNEFANDIDGDESNSFRRKREVHNLTPTLLSHMTEGFLYAGDMEDEMVIPTLNNESTLRINTYNARPLTVTVNCARIVRGNQHSLSGVIHSIDRVLTPVTQSIYEIVENDPQFSIFRKIIAGSEFEKILSSPGQKTLLAPTDEAFSKLRPEVLASLLEGSSCVDAVIKQHILPNTICSAAIQGRQKTVNILEEYMVVERTDIGVLKVGEATILEADLVGTNGVVQVVDTILMPNEAKTVGEVLESHNLTKFIELIKEVELMEELNANKDITVFAPSNAAFNELSEEEFAELKGDKIALKNLLMYHVTSPSIQARNINNNHIAETKAGHPLRINLYSSAPLLFGGISGSNAVKFTAGCSRVEIKDSRACGAVVHVIERMLVIPHKDVIFELRQEPTYSLFYQMVKDTEMDKVLSEEGPFTLLVPSDYVLKTLPEQELKELMEDNELKKKIVQRHTLREHVCCSGISPNMLFSGERKRTLAGNGIHLRRSHTGRLLAGPARITKCGNPAVNGVIHTVNRLLLEENEYHNSGHRYNNPTMRIFTLPRITDFLHF